MITDSSIAARPGNLRRTIMFKGLERFLYTEWGVQAYKFEMVKDFRTYRSVFYIAVTRVGLVHSGQRVFVKVLEDDEFCDRRISLAEEILYFLKASYKTDQVMKIWGINGYTKSLYADSVR